MICKIYMRNIRLVYAFDFYPNMSETAELLWCVFVGLSSQMRIFTLLLIFEPLRQNKLKKLQQKKSFFWL